MRLKRYRSILLIFWVTILGTMFTSCELQRREINTSLAEIGQIRKDPIVLVAILTNKRSFNLSASGNFSIERMQDSQQIAVHDKCTPLGPITVKSLVPKRGIEIGRGGAYRNETRLRLKPDIGVFFSINSKQYRGEQLRIIQNSNGTLSVVLAIHMEQYLLGVLQGEMPQWFEDEALKAQSIASRTYAMYQMKTRKNSDYHVEATTASQVFSPSSKVNPRLQRIANETSGIVLTYDWKIFPTYFHSTCGGHTEDSADVFGSRSIPPLSGVRCAPLNTKKDISYCSKSSLYRWKRTLKKDDITEELKRNGLKIGRVNDVQVFETGRSSNRVKVFNVYHGGSGSKKINANTFRLYIGAGKSRMPSTDVEIFQSGTKIRFEGKGFGHGVGMCQWGAQGMARQGIGYLQILRHYYPSSQFVKLY